MDNHHVNITGSQISCGVSALSRIESDTVKVLYAIATSLYHPSRGNPVAFVIWSDQVGGNGDQLAKEIRVHNACSFNLGPVTSSPVAENPQTSNEIVVFVWTINHEKFRHWYKEQRIAKAMAA